MPRRLEMSVLRTRCQRRADLEGNDHISDAEWNALISEKYGELFGIVCDVGLRYFETTQAITATGATSYSEPDDHMSTIGLDYVSADGSRRPLRPIGIHERDVYAGQTGDAYGYTLTDDQIFLSPNPASGSYELLYIPQAPDLSNYADSDLVDVVNADGEAFLIWGVSVLAKSKSESDVRLAIEREAAAGERLRFWAASRALTEARRRPAPDWSEPYAERGWPFGDRP